MGEAAKEMSLSVKTKPPRSTVQVLRAEVNTSLVDKRVGAEAVALKETQRRLDRRGVGGEEQRPRASTRLTKRRG